MESRSGLLPEFLRQVWTQIAIATSPAAPIVQRYLLGERLIQIRYLSTIAHAAYSSALAHLTTEQELPIDLTIYIWDSASTGVAIPQAPFGVDAFYGRREVRTGDESNLMVSYDISSGVLTLLDWEANAAICWCQDMSRVPLYERAAPLRTIWQWLVAHDGGQLVHAAAVGNREGAILLCGPRGSGKSTTAALCLTAGFCFIGEDYCLIERTAGKPTVSSLYSSIKLSQDTLTWFPRLQPLAPNRGERSEEKAVVMLYPAFAAQLAKTKPIRAMVVLTVGGRTDSQLTPATPGQVVRALAPTTLFQLADTGREALSQMAGIVRAVSLYSLQLGRDLSQIPPLIESLL